VPGDHALILSSWLRNNEPDPRLDNLVYFKRHEALIKELLTERPDFFRVLVDTEDSDHVYGWVCADAFLKLLHFVYVKPIYRRSGFARQLLDCFFADAPPDFHSHDTAKFRLLKLKSHFDPYTFFGGTP